MKTISTSILSLLFLVGAIEISQAAGKRPNILFIIADDQSPFDFKFYNPRSVLDAPVLEKLATEGMVIDGAYQMGSWVGGVCTASRHMIMSGRTVWHIPDKAGRIMNPHVNNPKMVPPDLVKHTLPAVFNQASYDTMRTCKNGNSYEAANKLFQVRHDGTRRGGTDERGSAWHAEQVLDYLNERQSSKDTDPFLIYFGFSHPHDVRDGKPELLAKYGAVNHNDQETIPPDNSKQPPLPVNYLPEHPFDHGHTTVRDEVAVKGVWKRRDERTIRNEIGRQFACSENIDIQVGRVLKKLEAMGEMDNTYIIYTADHGMAIGRHGLQGKQNLYDHTWRIPFIVKGPGIKAGSRAVGNIYLLDVLSTVCDLAGIKAPVTSEGVSFKPVLEGKQNTVRDTLYGVYCGGGRPGSRCVRKGDWKITKYEVEKTGVQHTQLFNLKVNPHEFMKEHHDPVVRALTGAKPKAEQINLASHPKYAAKLKEMEAVLLDEMRRHNDPYRFWNQPNDGLPAPKFRERKGKQKKAEAGGEKYLSSKDLHRDDWGKIISRKAEFYAARDVSDSNINLTKRWYEIAAKAWGNYGPLEFWIVGKSEAAAKKLDREYCEIRKQKAPSIPHRHCLNRGHNFVSYAKGGNAGLNTRRNENEKWSGFIISMSAKFPGPAEEGYKSVVLHEYFHVYQHAHIHSRKRSERESLHQKNPWWGEGGAEYMAQLLYSRQKGVRSGYLKEKMKRKLRSVKDLQEGESIKDIPYGKRARIAYDLGTWYIAFIISKSSEEAYRVKFYKDLNKKGFEGSFVKNFGSSSKDLLDQFHNSFLKLSLEDKLKIIP